MLLLSSGNVFGNDQIPCGKEQKKRRSRSSR